ncbi:hypothetical protein [Modestobacter sp. SSW1-42]|uniref:hypothetical protein n=1 Tax=Modestobacter sp. SSW1-42 TaxID=596372 RepID=UPI003985A88D
MTARPVRTALTTLMHHRDDVAADRAESRVAAFVYGNVLVLAAVVGASPSAVESGTAVVLVVGTVLSTFVAHVLAHSIGALFGGEDGRTAARVALRDAVPILSSGVTPAVLLGATALGWISAPWGQSLSALVLLGRVAGTGVVYRRLRADVPLRRAWTVGIVAAAVAAVAVVLKLALTH